MTAEQLLESLYKRDIRLSAKDGKLKISAEKGTIDHRTLEAVRDFKSDLILLLSSLDIEAEASTFPVSNYADGDSVALSFEQQSMLYLDAITEQKHHYNMSAAYKLAIKIDPKALDNALLDVIKKHSILRTVYPQGNEATDKESTRCGLIQHPPNSILRTLECSSSEQVYTHLSKEACLAFDLHSDLPIRVVLIRQTSVPEAYYVCVTIHHIAADGWSIGVFLRDLEKAYDRRLAEAHTSSLSTAPLPSKPEHSSSESFPFFAQYYDYALWQQKTIAAKHRQTLIDYWQKQLHDLPEVHSLPTDFSRPPMQSFAGATFSQTLSPDLSERIHALARQSQLTPFVVFQAIFAALLKRYGQNNDIVFGTVTANRHHAHVMQTMGMFANTLVLRYAIDDDCTFESLLSQAFKTSQDAFAHDQLPFDQLVDTLQPERSLAYNPLVQLMLVMQENHHHQWQLGGIDNAFIDNDQWVAKFDLSLHIAENRTQENNDSKNNDSKNTAQWQLRWEYSTQLFTKETVERINTYFQRMAECLLAEPKKPINKLPLVTLGDLPIMTRALPSSEHTSVIDTLIFYAQLTPEAPAVYFAENKMSYSVLLQRVNTLALRLQQTVSPGDFIGVCSERNADLIVSMFAIFRAGGVYVPIDSGYPHERIEYMVKHSGMTLLLTTQKLHSKYACFAHLPMLDIAGIAFNSDVSTTVDTANFASPSVDQAAYMIYTSGSTGKPKGVLLSHGNLYQSMLANSQKMRIQADDKMACLGSIAFGASILEMCLPFITGSAVQMLTSSSVKDISDLIDLSSSVSVMHMVPSLLKVWLQALKEHPRKEQVYSNLRLILTGGEPVPRQLLEEFQTCLPSVRILALYGMTESSIVCFSYDPSADTTLVTNYCLGMPHSHMQAFVMNTMQQLQPVGSIGELYLSGPSLALGYWQQRQQTEAAFINHTFDDGQVHRLYKTGDYARLLADGKFEFIGRSDSQVSIRGFRIEITEIERRLVMHEDIEESVVMTKTHDEHVQLIAYVRLHKKQAVLDTLSLRSYLLEYLPQYMVPAHFIFLEALPLNPNGKIDRKALATLDVHTHEHDYIAPRTPQEKILVTLWAQVLDIAEEKISIHDSFFDLGGDSILSMKVIELARMQQLRIRPQDFIRNPTIQSLASLEDDLPMHVDNTEGPLALTVLQKAFLTEKTSNLNHRHIKAIKVIDGSFHYDAWYKAFKYLAKYHIAMRSCFTDEGGVWQASIYAEDTHEFLELVDVSELNEEQVSSKLEHYALTSLDVHKGPLIKCFYLFDRNKVQQRIMLLTHHLLWDQIGLDIFLQDLVLCVQAFSQEKKPILLPQTASVRQIAEAYETHAKSEALQNELPYWLSLPEQCTQPFAYDFPQATASDGTAAAERYYAANLPESETSLLLGLVSTLKNISIKDLLLCAVVNVFARWSRRDWIRVHVMDNARGLLPGMLSLDTSRTVGPLCMYGTMCLHRAQNMTEQALNAMFKQLHEIPNKGLAYDLLYWHNERLPITEKNNFPFHTNQRAIVLNYHGVIDHEPDSALAQLNNPNANKEYEQASGVRYIQCPENVNTNQFYLHAKIMKSQLVIDLGYSNTLYKEETIRLLSEKLCDELRHMVNVLSRRSSAVPN